MGVELRFFGGTGIDSYASQNQDIAQTFSQAELNALIRDIDPPKILVELLGSRLKYKNLLGPGMSFSWYRNRVKENLHAIFND